MPVPRCARLLAAGGRSGCAHGAFSEVRSDPKIKRLLNRIRMQKELRTGKNHITDR